MASTANEMPRTRNEQSGKYVETYPDSSFIEAIEAENGAASTSEVIERVECSYETAYARLRSLEDCGTVRRRKVASANLWMLTEADP